ncbi:hypothetical protein G6F65_018522 [Rhizopus arrhizus]|nr:hypothetical protein G6F65_018522 [Rhizopus arrhizus]
MRCRAKGLELFRALHPGASVRHEPVAARAVASRLARVLQTAGRSHAVLAGGVGCRAFGAFGAAQRVAHGYRTGRGASALAAGVRLRRIGSGGRIAATAVAHDGIACVPGAGPAEHPTPRLAYGRTIAFIRVVTRAASRSAVVAPDAGCAAATPAQPGCQHAGRRIARRTV